MPAPNCPIGWFWSQSTCSCIEGWANPCGFESGDYTFNILDPCLPGPPTPQCDPGYVYYADACACLPECPPGEAWCEITQTCVPETTQPPCFVQRSCEWNVFTCDWQCTDPCLPTGEMNLTTCQCESCPAGTYPCGSSCVPSTQPPCAVERSCVWNPTTCEWDCQTVTCPAGQIWSMATCECVEDCPVGQQYCSTSSQCIDAPRPNTCWQIPCNWNQTTCEWECEEPCPCPTGYAWSWETCRCEGGAGDGVTGPDEWLWNWVPIRDDSDSGWTLYEITLTAALHYPNLSYWLFPYCPPSPPGVQGDWRLCNERLFTWPVIPASPGPPVKPEIPARPGLFCEWLLIPDYVCPAFSVCSVENRPPTRIRAQMCTRDIPIFPYASGIVSGVDNRGPCCLFAWCPDFPYPGFNPNDCPDDVPPPEPDCGALDWDEVRGWCECTSGAGPDDEDDEDDDFKGRRVENGIVRPDKYAIAYNEDDGRSIIFRRSAHHVGPAQATRVTVVTATTGQRVGNPSFDQGWDGELQLVYTWCRNSNEDLAVVRSQDDGDSWSEPEVAIANAKHGITRVDPHTGVRITAAYSNGTIQFTRQYPGDLAPSAPTAFKDSGGSPLGVHSDRFGLTYTVGIEKAWELEARPTGSSNLSNWRSYDDCSTWVPVS